MRAIYRFASFFRDSIFFRVCIFLYGLGALAFGALLLMGVGSSGAIEWLPLVFGLAIAGIGLQVMYMSVFGRTQKLKNFLGGNDRRSDSDGPGVVMVFVLVAVVCLLALPITLVVKGMRSLRRHSPRKLSPGR